MRTVRSFTALRQRVLCSVHLNVLGFLYSGGCFNRCAVPTSSHPTTVPVACRRLQAYGAGRLSPSAVVHLVCAVYTASYFRKLTALSSPKYGQPMVRDMRCRLILDDNSTEHFNNQRPNRPSIVRLSVHLRRLLDGEQATPPPRALIKTTMNHVSLGCTLPEDS